ncbi:MAG: molybdate ABC transporter substrate-binding protein, partial [Pseudoalteromonas sp.]
PNNKYEAYTLIPETQYPAIIQQAVILKSTDNLALSNKIMNYLLSIKVQTQIAEFGYKKD